MELIKEESSYLRYPLLDDLKNAEPKVSAASEQVRTHKKPQILNQDFLVTETLIDSFQLIKFHGSYQQENRELRKQGIQSWQFMMRTRQV